MRYFRNKQFALTPNYLQELTANSQLVVRQVPRDSLRKFFKLNVKGRHRFTIQGTYPVRDSFYGPYDWALFYGTARMLRIGCVRFNKQESKLIRDWALRKVRALNLATGGRTISGVIGEPRFVLPMILGTQP